MNELYAIMRDFLEVSYHQEALIHLLKAAEAAYVLGYFVFVLLAPVI